jgi:hypothetical protein
MALQALGIFIFAFGFQGFQGSGMGRFLPFFEHFTFGRALVAHFAFCCANIGKVPGVDEESHGEHCQRPYTRLFHRTSLPFRVKFLFGLPLQFITRCLPNKKSNLEITYYFSGVKTSKKRCTSFDLDSHIPGG